MTTSLWFVLVHGAGHGAWCWYKVVDRLQKSGVSGVLAIDLTSAGIDSADPNTVKTMEEYSRPLVKFMSSISDEKVILVAHSSGGRTVSYVMEIFPEKVAAAIFVTASMFPSGEKGIELHDLLFAANQNFTSNLDLFYLVPSEPATSMIVKKEKRRELLYNLSPSEDAVLSDMLLKPSPIFCLEDLRVGTTPERYGRVPRFYVKALEDAVISPKFQDLYIEYNPPKEMFELPSDHSPFFSTPDALVDILLRIASGLS